MSDPVILPASDAADEAFARLLAEFQAKYPTAEVESLAYPGGRMIVRTPEATHYARFVSMTATNRAKTHEATEALCSASILWPSPAEVTALFQRKPALVSRIADKLLDKAGADAEVTLGK